MAQQQMSVTMTGFAASHPSRSDGTEDLVTFRMASTPRWNTDGEWKDGGTLFIDVQCWGKPDNVLSCVVKGAAGHRRSDDQLQLQARQPAEEREGEPYFEEIGGSAITSAWTSATAVEVAASVKRSTPPMPTLTAPKTPRHPRTSAASPASTLTVPRRQRCVRQRGRPRPVERATQPPSRLIENPASEALHEILDRKWLFRDGRESTVCVAPHHHRR